MNNNKMQAMIFAAGLGTRLKPLTDNMPKALVKVGGEPLLKHIILKMKDAGFRRIIVNVHHFSEQIIHYLSANNNFELEIFISNESQKILDTGGGLKAAQSLFNHQPILVHNVDIFNNVDLKAFYQTNQDAAATLLVSDRVTKRYLLFDNDMRLVGWTNVETGEVRSPYPNLQPEKYQKFAFAGVHVFDFSLFSYMKDWQDKFGIIDFYLKICDKVTIKGHIAPNLMLMDVGKQETITQANEFLKTLQQSSIIE